MKTLKSLIIAILLSSALPAQVIISQVYGGGGNTGAAYANDFIELFNPTNADVNLSGWSVQYAGATSSTWNVTPLTGIIQSGHFYLIKEHSSGNIGSALPAWQDSGDINLSATSAKVALCNDTLALTDNCPLVLSQYVIYGIGYGTSANCSVGYTAPSPSNTKSLIIDDPCKDVSDNRTDFITVTPNPRNRFSPSVNCTQSFIDFIQLSPWIMIHYENSMLNITSDGVQGKISVVIYDSLGKTLLLTDCLKEKQIDISNWHHGMYFVGAVNEQKTVFGKFIK